MLKLFGFGEAPFHTGWFLESLATQTLVLFVIRTAGVPWRNRPSAALTLTTILVVVIGMVLPYTPFARPLGLEPLPAGFFLYLVGVVVTYPIVEVVKRRVMARVLE